MNKRVVKFLSFFILNKQKRKEFRKKYSNKIISNIDIINNINILSQKIDNINDFINKKFSRENYIYSVNLKGDIFYFSDSILSMTVDYVANEINNNIEYNFDDINFKEGDCVIDIGGNVGMVSIYLAKKYPFLKIFAFEPVKENYENFLTNIKLNNIPDGIITVENKAVTKDGRNVMMNVGIINKGGSYISNSEESNQFYIHEMENSNIKSTTLNDIFKQYNIKNLKLLKIDCEGSEFEILYNTDINILKKIEVLRGEFHDNIDKQDINKYNSKDLINFLEKYINDIKVSIL